MIDLDTLLDVPPLPEGGDPSDRPLEEATACIGAALFTQAQPVAWLDSLADSLNTEALDGLPVIPPAFAQRIAEHPQAWRTAVAEAQRQQAQAYAELLPLGSQPGSYPAQLLRDQCAAHEARLLARFGEAAPAASELRNFHEQVTKRAQAWGQARQAIAAITHTDVLRQQAPVVVAATREALLAEVRLQGEEQQLPRAVLERFESQLVAGNAPVLAVQWHGITVPQAWVLVSEPAWAANLRPVPLLLWVQGEGGGLYYTDDVEEMRDRLAFTLGAPLATPLSDQASEASSYSTDVTLTPLPGGLNAALAHLIESCAQRLDNAIPDAFEEQLDHVRAVLAIPVDATRQLALQAAERQWQADALAPHVPAWLLSRSPEERQALANELQAYHQGACALEYWLRDRLPAFATFAGQLLAQRIEADLGLKIDPAVAVLTRPVNVTYQWFGPGTILEPSPTGGFYVPQSDEATEGGLRWVPSDAWEAVTLSQLAMESVDAEDDAEIQRLKMAQWHVSGLTATYLLRVLPVLDPLKQYEQLLARVLDPAIADNPQRLRRPYEQELALQARMAHWQNRLSAEALHLLTTAAPIHDAAALANTGMKVHWLVIHANEERGRAIEGCCALVSGGEGRTVLCLPGAPAGYALLERETLGAAVDALQDAIRVTPAVAEYVAHRLGADPQRHLSYFRQAAQRGYRGYLSAPPSLDQTLVGIQLHDRRAWLRSRAATQGRSQLDVLAARNLAAHHRHLGYLRAGLSVLPGVGTLIALQDIYDSAQAVAAAWHQQDADALGTAALGVAGGLVDVLFTLVPGAISLAGLRRAVRAHVRVRNSLEAGRAALAGYEAPLRLRGASPLAGADEGTWRLDGEQYIWQDGRAYAVYRRADEYTLRLRATATRRYEAPVRRDGTRWVIHADTGLRGGGGKLTPAEKVFADFGPTSRHPTFRALNRVQAVRRGRTILERYDFLSHRQATEFAFAYLAESRPPAWAARYLRHGMLAPSLPTPDEPTAPYLWQQVRWRLDEGDEVTPGSYGGEAWVRFFQTTQARNSLRWEGHYYPLLPNDGNPGRVRYVLPLGRNPRNLRELDDLISDGRGPVRVLLGETPARAPEIVGGFTETFGDQLARRFPDMAPANRQAWLQAIYQHAEPGTTGLTHRRLMALEGLIRDPATDPLEAVSVRRLQTPRLHLTVDEPAEAFDQLRWTFNAVEDGELRHAMAYDSRAAIQSLLTRTIARRGYRVLFDHGTPMGYIVVFQHARQRTVHVLVQHTRLGTLSLAGNNGVTLLSPPWLDMLIARVPRLEVAELMRTARTQNRLSVTVGGLALPPGRPAELIWARVHQPSFGASDALQVPNWRQSTRPLLARDVETLPGSGMFREEGEALASGVQVGDRLLPIFPAGDGASLALSRPDSLPAPLTFEALERGLRERFAEQPWIVVRAGNQWTVRRHLFLGTLDRLVNRARPGVVRHSSVDIARAVFERGQGLEQARLLHLEQVLSAWLAPSQRLGDLADPILLLRRHQPTALQGDAGWQLALPANAPGQAMDGFYLQAIDPQTRTLVAALGRPRMRHHAANAIDDMLTRYGLVLDHRSGHIGQYRQPATGNVYLVAMQISENAVVEVARDAGLPVLSDAWISQWRLRLDLPQAEALEQAMSAQRVVRLVATLRLGGEMNGQVAVQRLDDF